MFAYSYGSSLFSNLHFPGLTQCYGSAPKALVHIVVLTPYVVTQKPRIKLA